MVLSISNEISPIVSIEIIMKNNKDIAFLNKYE